MGKTIKIGARKIAIEQKFMQMAISAALGGILKEGGPFGACIADFDGNVLSCETNSVIRTPSPTRHAEMNAIDRACAEQARRGVKKPHLLANAIIYSTTEPCPMCFSAIHWARIPVIVYGTKITDAKRAGMNELEISNRRLNSLGKSKIALVPNFMRDAALEIFREFKRIEGKRY